MGELAFDHLYCKDNGGDLRYLFSSGGGSAPNVIANIAVKGCDTSFAGAAGADTFGDAAVAEMERFGVDCRRTILQAKKGTLLVHETLSEPQMTLFADSKHQFSLRCAVCGKSPNRPRVDLARAARGIGGNPASRTFTLVVDRLNTLSLTAMREAARSDNCVVGLDLGRVGFLRYKAVAQTVACMRLADIIFLSAGVHHFIRSRLRLITDEQWAKILPGKLLLVGEGAQGLSLKDCRGPSVHSQHFAPLPLPEDKLVDDAGAGDAFFASILKRFAEVSPDRKSFARLPLRTLVDTIQAALLDVVPALGARGARGHLVPDPQHTGSILRRFAGLQVSQIQDILAKEAVCPFCESRQLSFSRMRNKKTSDTTVVYRSNLNRLVERVGLLAQRNQLLDEARRLIPRSGSVFAVGTGGSYAAAGFFSTLVNERTEAFAQVVRPLDYLRAGKRTDQVFVFTYSGKTHDCANVIKRAIDIGVSKIVLVTGPSQPQLKQILREGIDEVLSYEKGDKLERGFVAVRGTVFPCGLFTAAMTPVHDYISATDVLQRAENTSSYGTIENVSAFCRATTADRSAETVVEVFGGGWAWPAIMDLESKFAEGGLGCLRIHEPKDFSHGRFISVLPKTGTKLPAIYLTTGAPSDYDNALIKVLRAGRELLLVSSINAGALGALELLIKVQFIVRVFGETAGKDISRPAFISPRGLRLYHWNRKLG